MNVSEPINIRQSDPITTTVENNTQLAVGETVENTQGLKEHTHYVHSDEVDIGTRNVEKTITPNTKLSILVNPDNTKEQSAENECISSTTTVMDEITEAKNDTETSLFCDFVPIDQGAVNFVDEEEAGILDFLDNMKSCIDVELNRLISIKDKKAKINIPIFISNLLRKVVFPTPLIDIGNNIPIYSLATYLSKPDIAPLTKIERHNIDLFTNSMGKSKVLKKASPYIISLKYFLINLLSKHYYDKIINSISNGGFFHIKINLSKLQVHVNKYNTNITPIYNNKLPLFYFLFEHLKGNFDKSIKYLDKSVNDNSPHGVFNKSLIQLGLCNSYLGLTDPCKAFENLRALSRKEQIPSNKKANSEIFEIRLGLHESISLLWQKFCQQTARSYNYEKARDACFKMIASFPITLIESKESVDWLDHLNGEFLDQVIPNFLKNILYPPSKEGLSLWKQLNKLIRSQQLGLGYFKVSENETRRFMQILINSGIDEAQIPSLDNLSVDQMTLQLCPLLMANYEFTINYIHWAEICKHKASDKDKTCSENEKKKTIINMMNLARYNPDLPKSIVNITSCFEWGKECLAALFGFGFLISGNDQPNQKKARFLAEMCLLSSKDNLSELNYNHSQPYTSEEENPQIVGDTAIQLVGDHKYADVHSIIINAVFLVECGEHEQAIHNLQVFNENKMSGVVECMLGYLKECKLKSFSDQQYQTALQEVIIHYRNAAAHNILSASDKVTKLTKMRKMLAKKHAESQRLDKKKDNDSCVYTPIRVPSVQPPASINPDDISDILSHQDNDRYKQQCPIKHLYKEQEQGAGDMQKHNNTLGARKKYTKTQASPESFERSIQKYSDATSDDNNIDFISASSAIEDMEKNINSITFDVTLSRELQVKQYKAWYNYQFQKECTKIRQGNDVINECKQCFYQSLKKGFQLINCDIVPENPRLSIERIKESVMQYRISASTQAEAEEIEYLDIQVASMVSTWGHYSSDLYPNKNLHQDLYKLVEFLKPSKADTHKSWKSLKKLTMVDDISSLRPA